MSEYVAPLDDMRFVLRELVDFGTVAALPGNEEVTLDLADAILEEAGKFASGVISPLNVVASRAPFGSTGRFRRLRDGVQPMSSSLPVAGTPCHVRLISVGRDFRA